MNHDHNQNYPAFFTATIKDWKFLLKPHSYKLILIESLQFLVNEKRIKLYAYVIMDNHIHLIWQGTSLYSLKHSQQCFMKFTAQRIKLELELNNPELLKEFLVLKKDRKYQFWQRNSLSVALFHREIIEQKINYIHQNPVKAGICFEEVDYRFSSAKFYKDLNHEFDFLTRFESII